MTYTIEYKKLSAPKITQSAFIATSITDVRRAEIQFVKYYGARHPGDEAVCVIATRQPNGNAAFAENIDTELAA